VVTFSYTTCADVAPAAAVDLGDPVLRRRLERHFDEDPGYPRLGASDEYAALFERTYPDEEDRRRYIHAAMVDATPSYGHLVLAALFRIGKACPAITILALRSCLSSRIGRNLALRRPWSHSTLLLAYRSALLHLAIRAFDGLHWDA
jgi:hypothetical protein